MVTLNYQTFGNEGFQLRLRLYQDGETKYIYVTKLLKGNILKRHWNKKKQYFIPSCPFADENNAAIQQFKKPYEELAITWKGSLYGFIAKINNEDECAENTLSKLLDHIISEQKKKFHPDGSPKCSFECYEKTKKTLELYCKYAKINFEKFPLADVDAAFVNGIFDWLNKTNEGKGIRNISKMMHAVMNVAERERGYDMGRLKTVRWAKKKAGSANKYKTLTDTQCKALERLTAKEMPKCAKSELYRDFCIFLLYTGQSVCDALSLRYSDIETIGGVDHFVFRRRKIAEKQAVPCSVPINERMREIMDKWKLKSKDGYVFPVRSKEKIEKQKTANGDIKHFISDINLWLKDIAQLIGCDFSLHTYTFRHTAITRYISRGVPVMYVANFMGTSVKNCEQIYYNNQGDTRSRDMIMSLSL